MNIKKHLFSVRHTKKGRIAFLSFIFFLLLYWFSVFYYNQPLSEKNTSKLSINCEELTYVYGGHGHDDYMLIKANDNQYYFFYWHDGTKEGRQFEKDNNKPMQLEVTIWDHFPKLYLLNLFDADKLGKEIVDMQNSSFVSLDSVNKNHRTNFMVYSIGVVLFLSVSVVVYIGLKKL